MRREPNTDRRDQRGAWAYRLPRPRGGAFSGAPVPTPAAGAESAAGDDATATLLNPARPYRSAPAGTPFAGQDVRVAAVLLVFGDNAGQARGDRGRPADDGTGAGENPWKALLAVAAAADPSDGAGTTWHSPSWYGLSPLSASDVAEPPAGRHRRRRHRHSVTDHLSTAQASLAMTSAGRYPSSRWAELDLRKSDGPVLNRRTAYSGFPPNDRWPSQRPRSTGDRR